MDFREELLKLKIHFGVKTNKELGLKLELTEDGIKNWVRKKQIPKKYKKFIVGNNNVQVNGENHGDINLNIGQNNINSIDFKICELVKQLSEKEKEYYYHEIKSLILKKDL